MPVPLNQRSALLRRIACLHIASLFAAIITTPAVFAQTPPLRLEYTGRLFGYYRIEADEVIGAGQGGIKLAPVRAFLDSLPQPDTQQPDTLLLGMGDNFAPEFGASVQQEFRQVKGIAQLPVWAPCAAESTPPRDDKSNQWHLSAPESLYKSQGRVPVLADCDNVARFLITAGYRAVIPGREDFIYSASWLRHMSFLFKGASSAIHENPVPHSGGHWTFGSELSPNHPLHMLAANIRVETTTGFCPLFLSADLASKEHPCLSSDNSITEEMDWVRRIQETLSSYAVEDSIVRQASHDAEFRRQTAINQIHILLTLLTGYGCTTDPSKPRPTLPLELMQLATAQPYLNSKNDEVQERVKKITSDFTSLSCQNAGQFNAAESVKKLIAVTAGALNAAILARNFKPGDPQVLVSRELRMQAVELLLNLVYAEQKDVGFTIAALPSGQHTLLIGVVGRETMQQISPGNFKVFPSYQDCPTTNADPQQFVCETKLKGPEKGKAFSMQVGDPRIALTAVLRAAWAAREYSHNAYPTEPHTLFDSVIVMAQMPSTEAEELAQRVRADMKRAYGEAERPTIDLVLGEAQEDHETQSMELRMKPGENTPVLIPADASTRWQKAPDHSVSVATLSNKSNSDNPELSRLLENVLPPSNDIKLTSAAQNSDSGCQSAACHLKKELHDAYLVSIHNLPPNNRPATDETDLDFLWGSCKVGGTGGTEYEDRSCQDNALMQYLLRQLQRSSAGDVVLLERRDFYFGWLGDQYGDYSLCERWANEVSSADIAQPLPKQYKAFYENYCRLKVALDRVLWKGDYSERVMVDGATLTGLMKTAQLQTDQEQSLLARDRHQEWLMTYGIVTGPPKNLITAASGPDNFSIPGNDGCANSASPSNAAGSSSVPYCIDGQLIPPDHAYWITTSDQLAQDSTVYSTLGSLTAKSNHYASSTGQIFLTTAIADVVTGRSQPPELMAVTNPKSPTGQLEGKSPAESNLAVIEMLHQDRNLVQLDFTKLVAGYTFTNPSLSDNSLATKLSAVSNSQAATPHSQELDLQAASRLLSAPLFERFVIGVQTDAEYDRKVSGNLTGNPETVTYSANSYSVGGFTQLAIHNSFIPGLSRSGIKQSTRNLPRAFLVLAPYQYQRQMTGVYLNFPFFTPPGTSNPQQQLSIHVPTAMGFSQRGGLRYEFSGSFKSSPDPGSYFEIGPEYAVQNNALSAVKLPQISSTAICNVAATQSLQSCVKNVYKTTNTMLDGNSAIVPVTETLHTGGFYWVMHLQKVLDKQSRYSASFDTQGDDFLLPGAILTTQTRYAFSTKLALNFKVAGNLSLSPTYSDFFFENQGVPAQRTSLVATTFTIAAKWYLARDSQVPFRKQLWFLGPASSDQTTSAKVK